MNKRRRFKAKRIRRINKWRDHYNRPWLYGQSMFMVRREAAGRLREMGVDV